MERLLPFIGLLTLLAIPYGLSSNRDRIKWKTVIVGVLLQIGFGVFILKTAPGLWIFDHLRTLVMTGLSYATVGGEFVFGSLVDTNKYGFIFGVAVVPTIIFMGSLMSILYYLGIMQKVVKAVAWVMMRFMDTSGSESLVAAANIFVGQTEAPFVARPYVPEMTRSELMAMMTSGFATIAGGVMAAYVGFGIDAGHLLAASVMSAPAALVCSKLMVPEIEESLTKGVLRIHPHKNGVNVIDAAAIGATEGLHLALNVLGMLIAFIAIVALLNGILTYTGSLVGLPQLTFEWLLGYAFAPVSFLMGVPWHECRQVGVLLGERLVLNEFVAYYHLKQQLTELSPRTVTICTYALCGFCNFGSVAIQLGGIGTLAPDRRGDLARLGIRALIAGTFACLMTACIAGILI